MASTFRDAAASIGSKLGVDGKPWRRRRDVVQFRGGALARVEGEVVVRLQKAARRRRLHLIANPILRGDADDRLLLFAADDKYDVIAQIGPNIPNERLETHDIVAWLKALEAKGHLFELMGCSEDTVVGMFEKPLGLAAARTLAPVFKAFCKDILLSTPGKKTLENLAKHMADLNGFVLAWVRWDT